MRIGARDRLITIESYTEVNNKGSSSKTWSTFATAWAKKTELSGKETEEQDKLTSIRTTDWEVIAQDVVGINEKMRINESENGNLNYIISITEIGRMGYRIKTELRD